MQVSITKIDSQINTYQFQAADRVYNDLSGMIGSVFKPSLNALFIEEQTITFFDAVETIWTFTIICFTVIVMKLTKYVNLREKQESRTAEKAEFRDSICIFLAKMNGLLHGRHR